MDEHYAFPTEEENSPDSYNALDTNGRCTQAYYWNHVGSRLSDADRDDFDLVANIEYDTFRGMPDARRDGGSTWARLWVSYYLFSGVDYTPGISWHHPLLDYFESARGDLSTLHTEFTIHQVVTLDDKESNASAGARYRWRPFGSDYVDMSCGGHFGAPPAQQSAEWLHESWHAFGQSHANLGGFDGTDYYRAHLKSALGPGEMGHSFTALNDPEPEAPGSSFQSVNQTQYHLMCDLVTTPQRWVTNRTIRQARNASWLARSNLYDFASASTVAPMGAFECLDASLGRTTPQTVSDGNSRVLGIHLHGVMTDGDGIPVGSTKTKLDLDKTILVEPGKTFEEFNNGESLLLRADDDDTLFKFFVQAKLVGDELQIRYQAEFYEDPPDCEQDTSPYSTTVEGSQCVGRDNPAKWRTLTLDSTFRADGEPPFFLSNCWNEDCADSADFTISFDADF